MRALGESILYLLIVMVVCSGGQSSVFVLDVGKSVAAHTFAPCTKKDFCSAAALRITSEERTKLAYFLFGDDLTSPQGSL